MVAIRSPGSLRSYASVARNGCGNFRSFDRKLTSPIGGSGDAPLHALTVLGSTAKAGAGDVLPAVLQFRNVMMLPELTYAFSSHTYGGVPTNRPMPPRTWSVNLPVTSQLNPTRGDHCTADFGMSFVRRPYALSMAAL